MIIIKTYADIQRIHLEGLLEHCFVEELDQYFKDLTEHLTGEKEGWQTYNIERDGPILVLQPEVDDPSNLGVFGMTQKTGGLFGASIEFTDRVDLEAISLFKTILVLDNSFCLTIYSGVGDFGQEFDDYLMEHMAE